MIPASLREDEYLDLRVEENSNLTIELGLNEIEHLGYFTHRGGFVRVLRDGALVGVSFTDLSKVSHYVERTYKEAKECANFITEKVKFVDTPVVKSEYKVKPVEDFRLISLEEKLALLKHYQKIINTQPKVKALKLIYREYFNKKEFYNSEGSQIFQEHLFCDIKGIITTRDGSSPPQTMIFVLGGNEDFSRLRNREEKVEKHLKLAIDLLEASVVSPGVYEVVLDPTTAGVFAHEAFGHLSEADSILFDSYLRSQLKLGKEIATPLLSIYDQGNFQGAGGSFPYDDEGVASGKTYLIKEGKLVGRLHSRYTAYMFGEKPTGNARALDFRFAPIVRMSNVFIERGTTPKEELFADIPYGIYIIGVKGGQTVGDFFSFGCQYGYEIVDGKLGKLIRNVNMSGNLFKTFRNIVAIGDDFMVDEAGGCGKGHPMQLLWSSGHGGPHIRIKGIIVGGG